eukprot:523028-Pelagomonas_calceolata.AAC.1
MKEKETHWLRRAVSLLHHKAKKKKKLMWTWRVTGSTLLQNLAVRSITIFHSTSSGNKKRKTTQAEETLPTSVKEKETHWLRRAVTLLHHKATKTTSLWAQLFSDFSQLSSPRSGTGYC